MRSAASPHAFLGISDDGQIASVHTSGNPDTHIVLRGGKCGEGGNFSNYDDLSIARCEQAHGQMGLAPLSWSIAVMKIRVGSQQTTRCRFGCYSPEKVGVTSLRGIMLESFLEEGNQSHQGAALQGLTYGKSITDACLGWGHRAVTEGNPSDSGHCYTLKRLTFF